MASYKLYRCTRQVHIDRASVYDDSIIVAADTIADALHVAADHLPEIHSEIDIQELVEGEYHGHIANVKTK